MGESCIAVSAVRNFVCRPTWHVQLHQILRSVPRRFPVLPDTHPQSVPDVAVQLLAQSFHASDFEIVNPSSDKLIEFIHLICVTNSPALLVVPVRQAKGLPTASFRFHLTMDTLAVQLCTSSLPTRTRDFHPLERAHGAQTKKSQPPK